LFRTFAAVALADDVLAPEERAVLDRLAARLHLPESDAKRLLAEAHADRGARGVIEVPGNPADALELLEGMVKVAAADNVILPSERKLLEQVRQQLGIDPKRLESLIAYHLSAAAATAGSAPPSETTDPGARATDPGAAREHFHVLAVVAFCDHELAPEELVLLDRVRDRLGLDPAEATRIVEAVKADRQAAKKLVLSRPASGGGELFEDIVKVVAADRVIHPAERKLLERACDVLGVDQKRLRSLLAYAVPNQPAAAAPEPRSWLPWIVLALILALGLIVFAAFGLRP
jgi:uncharacterized tellurite resistance protein B-like protein